MERTRGPIMTLESSQTNMSSQIPPVCFLNVFINDYIKIVIVQFSCYMQPKAFLREDDCQLGILETHDSYCGQAVDSSFLPVSWAMEIEIPIFSVPLSHLQLQITHGLHVNGVIQVKGGKNKIFMWGPKELE